MGKSRLIFDCRDLDTASDEMLQNVDRAVVAAAFKIRDDMRSQFKKDAQSTYSHHTGDIRKLAEGISVGKLKNSKIKVHALGALNDNETYKTRFFVGGTIYRKQTQRNGVAIKPYSKGYLKSIDTIDKGIQNAENILNQFIKNAL